MTVILKAEMAALQDVLLNLAGRALEALLLLKTLVMKYEETENALIIHQVTVMMATLSTLTAVILPVIESQAGAAMGAQPQLKTPVTKSAEMADGLTL